MQSIKLNPSHALAYYNRGIAYYDRREFDRASQDLNQAIKLNPNYAGAFHDRGITNYNRRDFDAAVPSGDVALGSNYAITANNRASAYENKRDDDRVIQEVNQTIKSNNAPAVATLNQANLLYGNRKYDRAIPYYDQALSCSPAMPTR